MMATATQIMAQPQVVSRQPEPWTTAIHASDIVPFHNYPTGPRENGLDDDNEDTLE